MQCAQVIFTAMTPFSFVFYDFLQIKRNQELDKLALKCIELVLIVVFGYMGLIGTRNLKICRLIFFTANIYDLLYIYYPLVFGCRDIIKKPLNLFGIVLNGYMLWALFVCFSIFISSKLIFFKKTANVLFFCLMAFKMFFSLGLFLDIIHYKVELWIFICFYLFLLVIIVIFMKYLPQKVYFSFYGTIVVSVLVDNFNNTNFYDEKTNSINFFNPSGSCLYFFIPMFVVCLMMQYELFDKLLKKT